MKISLPEGFNYDNIAEVKDGILHIYRVGPYESLMRHIAYDLNGITTCHYCYKPLNRSSATLDHLIPKDLGGVSIPDNLCVCCSKCNEIKSNLLEAEYKYYLSLPTADSRNTYMKARLNDRKRLKEQFPNYYPVGWVTNIDVRDVTNFTDSPNVFKSRKYVKVRKSYRLYGRFLRPIVVDRNLKLLSGNNQLLYARVRPVAKIPAIILENVEVV